MNDLVMDSGRVTATSWNVITSGEDAEKILGDANAIAEEKMKEKFPTLPTTTLPSLEQSN
jgi:division protein CdvB (Snf7/Vps24/ESCRT-III family)